MYDVLDNFLCTGMTTIVEGSHFASGLVIAGNIIEMNTQNKIMQTVAKVCQSANAALLSVWLSLNIIGECILSESSSFWYSPLSDIVMLGSLGLAFGLPIITHLAEKFSPKYKEKINFFKKQHSTILKVINIGVAAIVIGLVLCLGSPPSYLFINSVSLLSTLYVKNHRSNKYLKQS